MADRKRTILIIEDDRVSQRTLNVLLTKDCYETALASDAVVAVSVARN